MTERESTEDRWNALLRVTRSWRLEWNVDHLLHRICREAVELAGLERGLVFMLERTGIVNRGACPELQAREQKQLLPIARGIAQQVVQSGRPLYAHELSDSEKNIKGGARMISCVPLTSGRGILGALYVDSRESQKGLTQKDQEFLEMLGLQAASALEHAILYQSAITDPLTGLYSHRHFQQEVEQSVRRAMRAEEPVTLLLIDLDHFKELNDTCGHAAGNQCLVGVAALLREALRSSDIIARFGGDEFEVLLPGTNIKNAVAVAEKIRTRIGKLKLPQDHKVTGTFGVASFPKNAVDAQSLFLRADEALYQAKEAGRNRTVCSQAAESSLPAPDSLRGQLSPRLTSFPSPAVFNATLGAAPGPASPLGPAGLAAASPGVLQADATMSPVFSDAIQKARRLDSISEQVDGHRVVQRLGTGSTGEVLLVRQPDLNREVALKRPLTPNLSAEQIAAFEQEARVTASLNHPGVVTIHTLGRDSDGRRYYTMNPLSGSSLAHILEGRKRGELDVIRAFNQRRMTEILQRVSETIAYAHQRGVSHLDLTPSNIIVGQFGDVTIIDWGSGSVSSAKGSKRSRKDKGPTQLAYLVGSPAYLAPELLPGSNGTPGPAADVYAMGAILYEMLTGRPPFLRETTIATLDALRSGELELPEMAAPDAGIESVLSRLCVQALQRDPTARPSAGEFSTHLGRHVRQETAWETIRFGNGEGQTPLRAEDWIVSNGRWRFDDGIWSELPNNEHILLWKVPVAGAFRFVCECWTEGESELALIGRAPLPVPYKQAQSHHGWRRRMYGGYYFEFGAEYRTCTKISRNGQDFMALAGMAPEKGRHYRLELEFDDSVMRCFIDNKIVFTFRDLFPESGAQIGFYAFGAGAHYKPLELHRETFGIRVPLMQIADELFRADSFAPALERYADFVNRFPQRLEGSEARLKMGICQAKLGDPESARASFASLAGTPFEPYALAEIVALNVNATPPRAAEALTVCRDILKRFPKSQAIGRVMDIAVELRDDGRLQKQLPAHEAYEHVVQFERIVMACAETPSKSQIDAFASSIDALHRLGRYEEALKHTLDFESKLLPKQRLLYPYEPAKFMALLAAGHEVAEFNLTSEYNVNYTRDWNTTALTHLLVRTGKVQQFVQATDEAANALMRHTRLLALLVCRDIAAAETLGRLMLAGARGAPLSFVLVAGVLVDSAEERLYAPVVEQLPDSSQPHDRQAAALIQARWAVYRRDFAAAADILANTESLYFRFMDIPLMQIMLTSLGYQKRSESELNALRDRHLCGTLYDLSEMFRGRKEPLPDQIWPHPLWRPDWRYLLALWHEARGDVKTAQQVAAPALDERYGLAHCQPWLRQLMIRAR